MHNTFPVIYKTRTTDKVTRVTWHVSQQAADASAREFNRYNPDRTWDAVDAQAVTPRDYRLYYAAAVPAGY